MLLLKKQSVKYLFKDKIIFHRLQSKRKIQQDMEDLKLFILKISLRLLKIKNFINMVHKFYKIQE